MGKDDLQMVKLAVFDVSLPTYLLDENFSFLDWNPAFDHLFAQPMKLSKCTSVLKFVNQFENRDQVTKRSMEVFSVDKSPSVDSELVIIETQKYGRLEMYKLAHLIASNQTLPMWVVQYNIYRADDLAQLFQDLLGLSKL